MTLWQQAVADKTKEIPVLEEGLRGLVVEGRGITVDAWLTQRAIAARLVHAGGDSVMIVKGNQPQLQPDIPLVFQDPPHVAEPRTVIETVDSGPGRLEHRRLPRSTALVGARDWPGIAHVFAIERSVPMKKGGDQRHDVV